MSDGITLAVRVVSNRLPTLGAAIHAELQRAVSEAAYSVEDRAKQVVPVRTGTLRRSIHTVTAADGLSARIGPSVEYGIYVEYGTRHVSARPYMRPAAEAVRPRFVDRCKVILRSA